MPTQTELKVARQQRVDAKRNKLPKRIAEVARRHEDSRVRNRRIIATIKSQPCADCGNTFPTVCMDFDHVRGEKKFGITATHARSVKSLLAEIAKCEVVCSNCHRLRTHTDEMKQRNKDRVRAYFSAKRAPEPGVVERDGAR